MIMKNYSFDDIKRDLGDLRGESFVSLDYSDVPCVETSSPSSLEPAPLVSVIMLAYNHEDFIAQSIEHVVNQKTVYPFELVIGEDCSTDRTKEIVLQYQKKYPHLIRVLSSDCNVGVKKNEWRVRRNCRGKYWAFCEGDDCWIDDRKLERQCRILEDDPQVGLVFSDCRCVDAATGKGSSGFDYSSFAVGKWKKNVFIDLYLHDRINVYTCSVMLRPSEEMFACPSIFSSNVPMADVQLWCTAAKDHETYFIGEKLGQRNKHASSLTATWDPLKASLAGIFVKSFFISDIYGTSQAIEYLSVQISNLIGNVFTARKRYVCPVKKVFDIIKFIHKYNLSVTTKVRLKLFLLLTNGIFMRSSNK